MQYTSSEANKLLKKLNADYQKLLYAEQRTYTFLAATGEDIESVRPEYDYEKTQLELKSVCERIRRVKHAINVFNCTTEVPGFNMTIDEVLVFMPQLSDKVEKLDTMRNNLPKLREKTYGTGTNTTIDYRYTNYDHELVAKDYEEAYGLLSQLQHALDLVNNTAVLNIDE